MQSRPGTLVDCTTQDGLRLHGFHQAPLGISTKRIWILVHGVASNFYGSSLLAYLSAKILDAGDAVLRVNTRGHDPVSYQSCLAGMHRGGAAFETIHDSEVDLRAWIAFAGRTGFHDIALLGHSLGAVKSLYMASRFSPPGLSRLVAISPPRLNFEAFTGDHDSGFLQSMEEARNLHSSGRSEQLMKVRYPFPMLVSAATYIDKYGSNSCYDYHDLIQKISCRTLVTFGGLEVAEKKASFFQADTALINILSPDRAVEVATIPDGDHNYARSRSRLVEKVLDWNSRLID